MNILDWVVYEYGDWKTKTEKVKEDDIVQKNAERQITFVNWITLIIFLMFFYSPNPLCVLFQMDTVLNTDVVGGEIQWQVKICL